MSTSANTMQCAKCGRDIMGSMVSIDCFSYHPSCYLASDRDATIAALRVELENSEAVRRGLEKERDELREKVESIKTVLYEVDGVETGRIKVIKQILEGK